jgi:predicted Zn-dependent protease/transglutaminase-like putative cysteine protease
MRSRWTLLGFLLLFSILPALRPQTGNPAPGKPLPTPTIAKNDSAKKAPDYSAESFIIQKYSTDITYSADGTGERLITVQLKVQSDAGVREFGVLNFPYESRNEHIDFVYVRVHKQDGSVVATSDADAQEQPAEVTRQAPFYSDLRDKQLPVKSLSVGDTLEYQVRQVRTVASAPGHFWYTQNFVSNAIVLEETASLNVPKQKFVQVESATVQPEVSEQGDRKIYRWKTAQLEKPKASNDKAKKPVILEQPPSIAVTTFKSWEEVGRWYLDLQKDRVAVTPAIQTKASELTKGLTADEDKIAATYTYVSTQYRYIGVAFGIGRYQPHSADDVMQNQYGDCKDKHTLLAALLTAEGYDAWPVLVGTQHVLNSKVPSPGQFDHVITAVTLNKTVLWMDSTPEVAPFRLLFYALRDKEVLAIPNNAPPIIMKTPANPPFDPLDKIEAKGTLSVDGMLNGHFDISLRGDSELAYRMGFHQTARSQWETLMQNISYAENFGGTTSNVNASSPEKLTGPFEISYDYTRKQYGDWDNRRILPLMPPLAFSYGEDDPKPADTIMLGGPGNYQFRTTITLPREYRAELPSPVTLHSGFADYATTYTQADGRLVVERKIRIAQREIPVTQWDEYLRFEKAVVADEATFIQLIGAGAKAPEKQAESNPQANVLVRQAFADMQAQDPKGARKALDEAAKINPSEGGLWSGYGLVDMTENKRDDAIKDCKKEIENHPEEIPVYRTLAGLQTGQHHSDDAIQTLHDLLKAAPTDADGHRQLAGVLISEKRYAEALPILTEAVAQSPDNTGLKIMLGSTQIQSGAKDQGAATLRAVLTAATDDGVLNDAAYELADANLELPVARASCEKALKQLDDLTAKISLSAITDDELRDVTRLAATWDTMAWILYRQGEFAEAEGYAKASWMLDQRPVIGMHLGQIYEKLGRKPEAIHAYQLAMASASSVDSNGIADAREQLAKLSPSEADFNRTTLGEEIGRLRSVTLPPLLPTAAKKSYSADYFVLFSPGQVEDAQFLAGDEALKVAEQPLRKASFKVPFPPASGARIVRRGIVYCSESLKGCQFTMLTPESTRRTP